MGTNKISFRNLQTIISCPRIILQCRQAICRSPWGSHRGLRTTGGSGKRRTWAIANYGETFVLPEVSVIAGTADQTLDTLKQVLGLGGGSGKVVIKHPMA
jgi:hypothetical protein